MESLEEQVRLRAGDGTTEAEVWERQDHEPGTHTQPLEAGKGKENRFSSGVCRRSRALWMPRFQSTETD